jgi:hypothetical protein
LHGKVEPSHPERLWEFIIDEAPPPRVPSPDSTPDRGEAMAQVVPSAPAPPPVALGEATMDSSCQTIDFRPTPPSARFPAGTAEIAYRVTMDLTPGAAGASGVQVQDNLRCSTPGIRSRQCNKYAIVMGEPVMTSSTLIVGCRDGKPFLPGAYELAVIEGGRPAGSVAFTIEGHHGARRARVALLRAQTAATVLLSTLVLEGGLSSWRDRDEGAPPGTRWLQVAVTLELPASLSDPEALRPAGAIRLTGESSADYPLRGVALGVDPPWKFTPGQNEVLVQARSELVLLFAVPVSPGRYELRIGDSAPLTIAPD